MNVADYVDPPAGRGPCRQRLHALLGLENAHHHSRQEIIAAGVILSGADCQGSPDPHDVAAVLHPGTAQQWLWSMAYVLRPRDTGVYGKFISDHSPSFWVARKLFESEQDLSSDMASIFLVGYYRPSGHSVA